MARRADYPDALRVLISQLRRMPGIGPRSAERMALWLVQSRDAHPKEIANALIAVTEQIHPCRMCGYFSQGDLCAICNDGTRDRTKLCVVEQPTDVLPLERSGAFDGIYHTLGGRISPLDHVSPDDLRIRELLDRIDAAPLHEVILALSSDVEGEATANYLAQLLASRPVEVTRIALGLPVGGGLDHADDLTLNRALAGRRKVQP